LRGVVAPMGTAFGQDHVGLIRRYARRCVLLFDADAAGRAAAERGLDLLLGEDLDISVGRLEKGDPADAGILARQAEIEGLEERCRALGQQVGAASALASRIERELAGRTGALEQARVAISDRQRSKHEAQIEALKLGQALQRYRERDDRRALYDLLAASIETTVDSRLRLERTREIVDAHARNELRDLNAREHPHRETAPLVHRERLAQRVEALRRLGEEEVAALLEGMRAAGERVELAPEGAREQRQAHVELVRELVTDAAEPTAAGPRPQAVALEEQHVALAAVRQEVRGGRAHDPAADDDGGGGAREIGRAIPSHSVLSRSR
jgi:DNA primase